LERSVYEALGRYVDDLSEAVFVGIARGRVFLCGEGEVTPRDRPPLLNLFWENGKLHVSGFWMEWGIMRGFFVEMRDCRMEIRGWTIHLRSSSGEKAMKIELHGNKGLARTLADALGRCL